MDRLKKVFRSAESEEPEQDLYILTLCRHRPRKETFPDSYNYDLARCSRGVSPQDEVSDSFHWLMDFETSSRDPEADWEEEEGEECRRRQYDIVKQRRKFAITRSKSFAQPVSKFVNTDERVEAGRKKYSQQLPRVQNNKVVRKKSLVFKTPEIESNERDGKQEEARAKRILTFHSLDEVLQVVLLQQTSTDLHDFHQSIFYFVCRTIYVQLSRGGMQWMMRSGQRLLSWKRSHD